MIRPHAHATDMQFYCKGQTIWQNVSTTCLSVSYCEGLTCTATSMFTAFSGPICFKVLASTCAVLATSGYAFLQHQTYDMQTEGRNAT